jgi:hypothetical protein
MAIGAFLFCRLMGNTFLPEFGGILVTGQTDTGLAF